MLERYTLPEMKALWAPENRFQKWLEIELLACEAWALLGKIPWEAVRAIKERARFNLERIAELEEVTRHDVIAFVSCVAESVGEEGRYLHYGLTSYDVVDTALSLLMRDALDLILKELDVLKEVLAEKARAFRDTVMIGRTHGVHAEPITLGLKFALWYCEAERARERLEGARRTVSVGRLAGAVGTYAHVDPFVEEYVCRKLGLTPARVSTQVLQRDRHAEYLAALALVASSIEKFATEIRHLQRTEVLEVEEPFAAGQKGSSAMPHKRNPIVCERLTGLARLVRGYALAGFENIPLWHERDITHSSVERIAIPSATTLVHYMVVKFTEVLRGLAVYPEHMRRNLELTRGLVFSQRLLLALVEKGLPREEAYALVQGAALRAWPGGNFLQELAGDPAVGRYLTSAELEALCDPEPYLARRGYIFWKAGLGPAPVALWEEEAREREDFPPELAPEKKEFLYEGKAKIIYKTADPDVYLMEFKDTATAFDGVKKEEFAGKGSLNAAISARLFALLERAGVPTHFLGRLGERTLLVKAVEIVPLEVIVRNICAGSMARRLGVPEGKPLPRPIVSFSLKSDALHDPLITPDEAVALGFASAERLEEMQALALKCNEILRAYFAARGLILVDFKLEFGVHRGELLLADEITPDTCRLWDEATGQKLDKDVFRRDLGELIPAYAEVWRRMQGGS